MKSNFDDVRCALAGTRWPDEALKLPAPLLNALRGLLHPRQEPRWRMSRLLRSGLFPPRAGLQVCATLCDVLYLMCCHLLHLHLCELSLMLVALVVLDALCRFQLQVQTCCHSARC